MNYGKELAAFHEQVAALVDAHKISLSHASLLAILPKDEQLKFVDRAVAAREFERELRARASEIRKNR